jgi:hypothetical protein
MEATNPITIVMGEAKLRVWKQIELSTATPHLPKEC